ncbi:UDP-glucose/GDP-mannose dehydrogenase family protein [Candidatus Bathyarchaeota archaeon]|nr:UDP-glucose/GDP-mannose dehydrogenase family protein [Candidatus Bathyarchaeota archaeon]
MGRDSTKISFVGLGYVGLCTATVFATKGIQVTGIDIDTERIQKLTKGEPPFHEPGLEPMLKTAIKKKTIEFTTDIRSVADGSTTFVTVGTPSNEDGSINLSYVKKATEDIGSAIRGKNSYELIVVKSTVVPGTAIRVVKPILESSSGKTLGDNLGLCSNPEFLAEGAAIKGTLKPDKIVIGAADEKSGAALSKLYRRVYSGNKFPTIMTNPTTAETIKYASNTFLATRVSTINTIANVCQRLPEADVETVSRALGLDPRIGPLYLKAGPGYGGSCFHKDLQAFIAFSHSIDYDPVLLSAVEEVNQRQAEEVLKLCEKLLGSLADRRVSVLGLAFKKDTDDVREAASLRVIDQLVKKNARVSAYDPMAIETARRVLPGTVEFAKDYKSCLAGSDCCILMTEWDEFRRLKPSLLKSIMKSPNIVDARRILDADDFREFNYLAVGLGAPTS